MDWSMSMNGGMNSCCMISHMHTDMMSGAMRSAMPKIPQQRCYDEEQQPKQETGNKNERQRVSCNHTMFPPLYSETL